METHENAPIYGNAKTLHSLNSSFFVRTGIIILVLVISAIGLNALLNSDMGQKNFLCSKKENINKPPKNITFMQRGYFSKTCVSSAKKNRFSKGECGPRLRATISQGYICKRLYLDID